MISWVIKRNDTKEVVCETTIETAVRNLNTKVYHAVPIMEHLQSLNSKPNK